MCIEAKGQQGVTNHAQKQEKLDGRSLLRTCNVADAEEGYELEV